ncbi:MAG TPA: Gfo/Idh/MocA family oxidoreductase [Opitutus sp.]|nr:Gfo/Idh/MocA family oxidoreductase [Opitutus sp.]
MNRRSFVSTLAVAGAATAANPSRLFAAESNKRPRLGLIGCGWFGGVNLDNFVQNVDVEVVALCDPNAHALETTKQAVARRTSTPPRTFSDYREMLASGAPDIVIVATPDHWHALPAIAAMEAGADVFLEKPISVDVREGEALVAAARRHHRVVQVHTQRRSNPIYARARDRYLRSGRLGPIGLIETFSYLPGRTADVIPEVAVPAHLDYERWTGPAPLRPFNAALESRGWRNFMEYGNGQIGDLGVHQVDLVRWMLGLGWPQAISSTGGIYVDKTSSANISDTQRSVFHYPGFDLSWEHRTWGASPIPARHWSDQWGARIIGQHGTLAFTMLEYVFTPAGGGPREGFHMLSKSGDLENIDFSRDGAAYAETERLHILDFMQAREARTRPVADIEEGHISTASCILANLAQELGRPLRYDPATRSIPGDAEATARLARPYRAPWPHPAASTA